MTIMTTVAQGLATFTRLSLLLHAVVVVIIPFGTSFTLSPHFRHPTTLLRIKDTTVPLQQFTSFHRHQCKETTSRHHPRLSTTSSLFSSSPSSSSLPSEYDVIVIGSGIGGLTCAALLSLYNYSVAVLESHNVPGGCAHGFTIRVKASEEGGGDYHFDTGPSFFSGLSSSVDAKASNPLRVTLDAIGEPLEGITYKSFGLRFPEGEMVHTPDFKNVLESATGAKGRREWDALLLRMKPLAAVVDALPTAALRLDPGALRTVAPYLKNLASVPPWESMKLTSSFSRVVKEAGVTDPFLKNWLDVLCFCLSGLPAEGTITAEMALMMGEFYGNDDTSGIMDCPVGGAKSVVEALVRGIEKHGGRILCNSHVEEILVEEGRAVGVRLSKGGGMVMKAKKAVVSNVSIWNLLRGEKEDLAPTSSPSISPSSPSSSSLSSSPSTNPLLPHEHLSSSYLQKSLSTPPLKSFMHLHLGFRATRSELSALQAHYIHVSRWDRSVTDEENVALVSIPSVHDVTLAPEGYAVLHVYTPATESFERWRGMDPKSDEYRRLKEERSGFLWEVIEGIIPDIRQRVTVSRVGTPLTHRRFLRRWEGSYGPAIAAPQASFPLAKSVPIEGLLVCGDSCFPGIGVPAVAGSGMIAAHSVDGIQSLEGQLEILEKLRRMER